MIITMLRILINFYLAQIIYKAVSLAPSLQKRNGKSCTWWKQGVIKTADISALFAHNHLFRDQKLFPSRHGGSSWHWTWSSFKQLSVKKGYKASQGLWNAKIALSCLFSLHCLESWEASPDPTEVNRIPVIAGSRTKLYHCFY